MEDLLVRVRKGRMVTSEHLTMRSTLVHGHERRLAVSVPARVIPKAVQRNRVRRRVSDLVRTLTKHVATGYVCLVTVKKADVPEHDALKNEVMILLKKSAILGQ